MDGAAKEVMPRGRSVTIKKSGRKITATHINGHTASGYGAGTIFRRPDDTQYRKHRPECLDDIARQIPQYHQRKLISDARYIYQQSGMVAGAIHKKADYVVGESWTPQYVGKDAKYREAAEPVVKSLATRSDIRGSPYDLPACLWLSCVSMDRDGECFAVLTRDPDNGEPRTQFFEAHRIGSLHGETEVADGEFKGRTILNGIVYDEFMRPLAYNLLPPNKYDAKEYNFLPASSVVHLFDPRWFSQGRGIPSISYGILSWYDIDEILDAEKIAVKANSSIALIAKNETGTPDLTRAGIEAKARAAAGKDPAKPRLDVEEFSNGTLKYIKSNESLEAHKSDRPSSSFQGFLEHCARGAFLGMDWPIEVAFDMSSLGGASVRAVVHQAQRSVASRQARLFPFALRILRHLVAGLMARGQIPFTNDWWNWSFTYPAKFSVDVGRDRQNARMDLACGLTTLKAEVTESGGNLEEHLKESAEALKLRDAIAAAEGVDPLELYNPRAFAVQAPQEEQSDSDDDEDEDDKPDPKQKRQGGEE